MRLNLKHYDLGDLGSIKISADRSAVAGVVLVLIVNLVMAFNVLQGTGLDKIMAGVLATFAYFISLMLHHIGHYLAGLYTGYPLYATHFYLVLARDLYPASEPKLSPNIHIRRAMGGPAISVIAALLCLFFAQLIPSGILWFVFAAGFWFNLLVFTLGALIPFGGLDGDVLVKNLRNRKAV